jgi:L-glutamine---4-(methylsulfanyl)-2-oxobutanoate aminotransferase
MPVKVTPSSLMDRLPVQFFSTLVGKVQQSVAQGHDVINLGQGNPDQPTPSHIVERLREEALKPEHHRYSPFSGRIELKQAIAHWYKQEHNVDLDPETEVAILFGAKTGLVEISPCLLNPGDIALVPDPGYPDYWSGMAISGGKMVTMPLLADNDFLPDYDAIPTSTLDKAKLMFLNYPNNPTGAVANHAFFKQTIELAERHNIVIAHDFAYGAIGFDGHKPISFLELEGAKEVGVEFCTLSKTYNMAGWRVGFAAGNKDVIRLLNEIQDHYYVSLFGGIQMAAVTALTSSQDSVRELVQLYERRRNRLYDGLASIGWQARRSQGSFFCWLPVPKGFDSVSFSDYLLDNAHVVMAAGKGFGVHGEGYVRVGLLVDEPRIEEMIDRLRGLPLTF